MNVRKVCAIYFSPTGNSQKIVCAIAQKIAEILGVELEENAFTLPGERAECITISEASLLVIGSPTYAGKLPNKILPDFQHKIKGNNTLAVPIVTFGNRAFDNALAELVSVLSQNGFLPIAAAAIVSQHAFSDLLAPARPDALDFVAIETFAQRVAEKIMAQKMVNIVKVPGEAEAPYYIPKGIDGAPVKFLKAKPITDKEKCNGCRICAQNCPTGSISLEDPTLVEGVCIKCHSCIYSCPSQAKFFDDPAFLSHVAMLEQHYKERKESMFFYSKS